MILLQSTTTSPSGSIHLISRFLQTPRALPCLFANAASIAFDDLSARNFNGLELSGAFSPTLRILKEGAV